ncbi:hypothetical protein [Methylomagnum sp.]
MKIDQEWLLSNIEAKLDDECVVKAAALLRDNEAHVMDGDPAHEKARWLLQTLKARQEISARTGKRIFGLDKMIARLAEMEENAVVLGYGIISSHAAGNIYFAEKGHRGLGAILVDR